jgi:hypothetical protein
MSRPMETFRQAPAYHPDRGLTTRRGRLWRCRACAGLHFQFGNLSARLDAESFLRLSSQVDQAATFAAPGLAGPQKVAIPMGPGNLSLLLDVDELKELHGLVLDGLKWLDEPEETGNAVVN